MTKYMCAVKLATANGTPCGTGWFGIVEAESPADAKRRAEAKHRNSGQHPVGDLVVSVEVRTADGSTVVSEA